MAVEDWTVELAGACATNGALRVGFYDTNEGVSLNVLAGADGLSSIEQFGILQEAMQAVYIAKLSGDL